MSLSLLTPATSLPTHAAAASAAVDSPGSTAAGRRRLTSSRGTSRATGLCGRSDAALILAIRAGDMGATGVLFQRHYEAALRAARGIGNPGNAEDLASEAFTKVVISLLEGRGPDRAIRPYLVMTIRHLFIDSLRKGAREVLVDDDEGAMDCAEADTADQVVERSVILDVLAELPERWREVLWRTIVLDEPLAVVGASMGLNPNAAAQLNFRARAGLSKAYRQRFASSREDPRRLLRKSGVGST